MTNRQPGASAAAVAFRDVVKVYHPDIRALDRVSFDIHHGETVALLGPNGAGKSTAIDTMLGLRAPTSGRSVSWAGRPRRSPPAGSAACCRPAACPRARKWPSWSACSASSTAVADLAASLHLSQGTVRNHLSPAIQKLGARNRAEAIQVAERKGWR
jgi:ABC-type cobalamin/Fe3+-siderophores transport system ATPase subunit